MKVEVWSDVLCPFCYLGKRKFEMALEEFEHSDQVEVVWKSFQLQPGIETDTTANLAEHLAKVKGFPVEQARKMNAQLSEAGKQVGLTYNFDDVVVANSFRAHCFLHFAKNHGKQNEAKELIFEAYFRDGKNVDDAAVLNELISELGLSEDEWKSAQNSKELEQEVRHDIYEAQQIGVSGVPYFVFNDKYSVTGAQQPETFLGALRQSFEEWQTVKE
ncbi:DsbA family oxidoreductase [Halocola ammonii]